MNNYKLTIQYDGSGFAGWQIQKNAPSVQDEIRTAIKVILREEVNLIGSGRTDSGVHALGQVANFRTETEIDTRRFFLSLNSVLPETISVTSIEKADESFHSRFDAKSRSYIYLISKVKSPFFKKYSMYNPRFDSYDFEKLKALTKLFIGEHDFTSFCRKESETENRRCIVKAAQWRNSRQHALFYIEANRFLHGMVRTVTGTLLNAVKEERDEKYIKEIFEKLNREEAGEAVPPNGLFLYKVRY